MNVEAEQNKRHNQCYYLKLITDSENLLKYTTGE